MLPAAELTLEGLAARFAWVDAQTGFLPSAEAPLARLADPHYGPWERLMDRLPDLLPTCRVRPFIDQVPPRPPRRPAHPP